MSENRIPRRRASRRTVAVAAVVSAVALAAPAPADAGGRVVARSGDCAGRGTWTMKVSNQDRGLQTEFEIDINRVGQRWRVRLFHNGRRAMNVVRTTHAPSGGFTVRAVTGNAAGVDRFRVRAVRLNGGNSCVGRVAF
jgi:hypothetical protein